MRRNENILYFDENVYVKVSTLYDGRFTIKEIANVVGISPGAVFLILKKNRLGLRQINARWIPHQKNETDCWLKLCRKLQNLQKLQ